MSTKKEKENNTVPGLHHQPVKILAIVIAIYGIISLIFVILHTFEIYLARLITTSIAFIVLISANSRKEGSSPALVKILMITLIVFSGFVAFKVDSSYQTDLNIIALLLLLISISVSWKMSDQFLLVVFAIVVFAAATYFNSKIFINMYNYYSTFAVFLTISFVSIIISRSKQRSSGKNYYDQTADKDLRLKSTRVESLDIYREIFDSSLDGIFRTSLNGNFLLANSALVKMLGYNTAEEILLLDIPTAIYIDPEDREKLTKILAAQKRVKNYRLRLKKKDGSEIIARVSERLVFDESDEPLYFEGSMQDITQQAKLEEERKEELLELREEKKKAIKDVNTALYTSNIKAQFLASMSHEIKTPINSIIGFLTLIEKGMFESEGELKDFARNAKTAADSLLDIINNVLDISKIEAGKMELNEDEFNIRNEIDKSISILKPTAVEKKLQLSFEITKELPNKIYGDNTRFRQIVVNILSNAVKYTDKGEVKLKVDVVKKTEATVKIKITVIDTGRGIPKEKLPLMFKPYTQLKDKKWTRKEGTGLGLMISKEFIKLMGGDINIYSEEGIGTTVEFTAVFSLQKDFLAKSKETKVDIKQEKESAEVKKPDKKEEVVLEETELAGSKTTQSEKSSRKRLLLVEDNPISQKVEKKLLSESGYDVEAVSSAFDAIEAVKTNSFDLVLMDIEMPDMDGLTATQKIRSLDPSISKIPIIAVTAHSSMKDREKCLAAGMNDYIAKPININFMRMTIDQWLHRVYLE